MLVTSSDMECVTLCGFKMRCEARSRKRGESGFIRLGWLSDKRGIAIVSGGIDTVRGRSVVVPFCSIVAVGVPLAAWHVDCLHWS
jgi:hypothetical protein